VRKQTALMWAAAEQHLDVVRLLAGSGADLEARSNAGMTPLMFAIRSGNIDVTRALLDLGASLEATAPDGTTALALAIINAHWELARFLLDRGADPNGNDPHGPPLIALTWMRRAENRGLSAWLPRKGDGNITSADLAEALIARGAQVNARAANPGFPNHMALGMPGTVSFSGATPLWIASKQADVDFMKFLLARGADPSISTDQNVTPLLAAAGISYTSGESPGTAEEAFEAVKLLQAAGNDVKAVADFGKAAGAVPSDQREGWDGASALHGAVIREAKQLVEYLIAQGVSLAHGTKSGQTPLDLARGSSLAIGFHVYPQMAEILERAMASQGIPVPGPKAAAEVR
jgi:ankyrin repeat protein